MANKKKFSVYVANQSECVKISEVDSDLNACSIALAIHQHSNCPHSVLVYDETDSVQGVKILDVYAN